MPAMVVSALRGQHRLTTDPLHLTPSEQALLAYIDAQVDGTDSLAITKQEISVALGRSVKTVDRAVTHLRRLGMLETAARFLEHGAQGPSAYRVTLRAKDAYPNLFF